MGREGDKAALEASELGAAGERETAGGNPFNLERRSTFIRSLVFIVGFLSLETSKQLLNFSLTTSNEEKKYPIPTQLLIVFIEGFKLTTISIYLQASRWRNGYKPQGYSFKFAVPAFCYFFTNLMYLYALTATAPPIWVILIQTRILYTALLYKVAFNKNVTLLQAGGCVLIVASIALTRISEIYSGKVTISLSLLLISQLSSFLSSVACLSVELLLKNDTRSFAEQQFWLYFWGLSMALTVYWCNPQMQDFHLIPSLVQLSQEGHGEILGLLVLAIIVSAFSGLCVPCIVRNLDSIVKDYLVALNNILLAYLTAVIFPLHFYVNYIYGISLCTLVLGIVFYERKNMNALLFCFDTN